MDSRSSTFSEGTLAVITKCLLRLVPKPEASLSVLVPYADLKTGIQSVLTILRANANPTAVEFMERKVVALGERFCGVSYPRPDAGSYILLTFDGRSEEVTANAARVRSLALQNGALDFIELSDARQCADIWRVRGALVKAVEAVSEQEPVDIVVPISRTADFIRFINDLEARSGMQMVSFGHAGDGNVHLCVVRGERDEETWQRELHENMDRAYAEAYRPRGGRPRGEAQAMRSRQADIGALLSAKADQTAVAVHRVYDEYTALKFAHFGLCSQLFDALAAQLGPDETAIRTVPGLDPDGLHRLAARLSEATTGLCAALTANEKGTGYCLAQAGGDVRALTKALNTALNGRGGGKPGICQGSCAAAPEQVETFLKENHTV